MNIHFICRGNAFRSIMAEAYLRSKELPGIAVLSSGTVASEHKTQNRLGNQRVLNVLGKHGLRGYAKYQFGGDVSQKLLDHSDIAICMNERVYRELVSRFVVPSTTKVWDVADMGERGSLPQNDEERISSIETAFEQIVQNVDALMTELQIAPKE